MAEAIAKALARDRTIDITTTGRRSGRPQRVEIWWHRIEGRHYISGLPGARGWYANLGESIPDLAGIAWPVHIGGQAYAISIAGPRYRVEPRIEEVAAMLRAACRSIEEPQRSATAAPPRQR